MLALAPPGGHPPDAPQALIPAPRPAVIPPAPLPVERQITGRLVTATRAQLNGEADACPMPSVRLFQVEDALGGISALAPGDDPDWFVGLSDAGRVFSFTLQADRIDVVQHGRIGGIRAGDSGSQRDSEALVRLPDGRWLVGFERFHRLMLHAPGLEGLLADPVGEVAIPADWTALDGNRGVEALALIGPDTVVAIAEGDPLDIGDRAAWIVPVATGFGDHAARTGYDAAIGTMPTDAAAGPNGRVYVLERVAIGFSTLSARIVRIAPTDLSGDAVLDLGAVVPDGNYEGLAIVPAGRLWRLAVASDGDDSGQTVIAVIDAEVCAL